MNDTSTSNQLSWKGTHEGRDWEASVSKLKDGKLFVRKIWLVFKGKRQMGSERAADVHASESDGIAAIQKFVSEQKPAASFK
ncbi:MAG: hypothetical protein ABI411_15700 [Tahibacter sp.]